MPGPVGAVVIAVVNAQPAVPGQIHGKRGEIQHHPAEDAGDQGGIGKIGMSAQMRMGALRIIERGQRDSDSDAPRGEHHHRK